MLYQFPLFALAHVIAAALSLALAVVVYTRRANPGYLHFTGLLLNLAFWSAMTFMEVGALEVEGKRFWSQWQYLAIVSIGPVWLLFAAHLSHRGKFLSNPWRHLVWIIPLITLFAAFTDDRLGLLWGEISIPENTFHPIAVYGRGPLFFPHIIFTYSLMFIGTVWIVQAFLHYPRKRKKQLTMILVLFAIGWLANIIYILGLSPIPGLDVTSLSFTFIAAVLFWFIARKQLFDLVPIARGRVVDNLAHGVIVINDDDVIVDINHAALSITNYKGPSPLGITIWEMFADFADLLQPLRDRPNLHEELDIPSDPPRCLDLQVTAIQADDDTQSHAGQIITIRDITQQKNMQKVQDDQRRLAEALADTAAAVNSTLELDEVLERILENAGKVVPHDAADIALVNARGMLHFVRTKGYEKYRMHDGVGNKEYNINDIPNMQRMAKSGQACLINDTQTDPDWVKDLLTDEWIRSYIGAPIISRGRLLGFISLNAETPNYFKTEQLGRLRAFADQAAIAIENAQLFSDTARRAEEMRILNEIGFAITSGLSLEKTVRALFDQLKKVIPIDLFYLALVNQADNNLKFHTYDGKGKTLNLPPLSLTDQPSLTRYTIEKRKTVYIPDVHAPDAEYPYELTVKTPGDYDGKTHLGVPLILGERVLGALAMRARAEDAYTPDQICLVETIANQASVAMDNARMFEEVQHLAVTDSLTGIYNRRYFFPYAQKEIERARRYKKSLSIILMDIDHFKNVNDRFGHLVGDRALNMVALTCLAELRKVDVMARFGGEEFIILLPETPKSKAALAARRIRDAVADARLPVDGGEVALTISIGVAELDESYSDINALIQAADKALYQAKDAGRNEVMVV